MRNWGSSREGGGVERMRLLGNKIKEGRTSEKENGKNAEEHNHYLGQRKKQELQS